MLFMLLSRVLAHLAAAQLARCAASTTGRSRHYFQRLLSLFPHKWSSFWSKSIIIPHLKRATYHECKMFLVKKPSKLGKVGGLVHIRFVFKLKVGSQPKLWRVRPDGSMFMCVEEACDKFRKVDFVAVFHGIPPDQYRNKYKWKENEYHVIGEQIPKGEAVMKGITHRIPGKNQD